MNQVELWKKIKNFELDAPTAKLSFSDRLARENRWTKEFSLRCIFEYKRFIFLICEHDKALTPSDQVDQVWHLHLLYTQSYWIDFCLQTLGRTIHHHPTQANESDKRKFKNDYQHTQELYEQSFKSKPPLDIWPDVESRFSNNNFKRINLNKYWLIAKLW